MLFGCGPQIRMLLPPRWRREQFNYRLRAVRDRLANSLWTFQKEKSCLGARAALSQLRDGSDTWGPGILQHALSLETPEAHPPHVHPPVAIRQSCSLLNYSAGVARSPQHSSARRRLAVAVAAALTITAGLLVHRLGSGIQGDIAGDALYGALIYFIFVLLLPRHARSLPAALAIMFCTAIEFLQLTALPSTVTAIFPPAALMFGTGFNQRDLLVYAFAVICVMLLDIAISRIVRPRARSQKR